MKTKLVVKLIAVLVLLLAVVLYKMNDFYKQEKLFQAEAQVHKQIISVKTAVASQILAVKNALSSFDVEIHENQINWVQLDPFFALARLEKKADGSFTVLQYFGRSGTLGERWSRAYLEKALSVRKSKSTQPIQARLFKDRSGAKFLALIFSSADQQQIAVVGGASYFQKYFDLERGGPMTSALMTTDHILAAHSESDYIASVSDEEQLSKAKYIFEKEEILGTNLEVISYSLKKMVAAAWMVPWSVVSLIFGFGFVLIGILFYGLGPLDKKIERYKKQEREQVFKETLQSEMQENQNMSSEAQTLASEIDLVGKTRRDSVEKAQEAFSEPVEELAEAGIRGPLQQALFNLDSVFKQSQILIEKDITTCLAHSFYYGSFIKSFENILRNSIEALADQSFKKITVRAYDVEQTTIIEIQDNGVGLNSLTSDLKKVWQPFFTTKSKADHMGLGLTEALSIFRRCGGDLSIESLKPQGALVKMIFKKEGVALESAALARDEGLALNTDSGAEQTHILAEAANTAEMDSSEMDLDKVLSLDDIEIENIFTPQKINLKNQSEINEESLRSPKFVFSKKTYLIDELPVIIRRPEKS